MGRLARAVDWIDLLTISCLGLFGLFLLLSVSHGLFTQQALYLVMGFFLMIVLAQVDAVILLWFAPYGYVLSLLLLLAAYLGPTIRGATRWIMIGGIQLQPSELAKPLILLAFSWLFARYPPRNLPHAAMHTILFAIPFILIFKQPDLGSALVFASSWMGMMIAAGFPIGVCIASAVLGSILLPVGWEALHPYQRARILTFLDPGLDPKGAGYNALQAMIAVGSGQLFGRGLGRGTQSHLRFLPEYHTDFIFASLVEEFGFFGGILLLLGYAVLLWRTISPLLRGVVDHLTPFVYSIGLFMMLLTQIFINAGMNMGIIPITGITLPLVSYGGSSILSIAVSFGMLWSLRRSERRGTGIAIAR
ncbi:rod shape-determining protein RodA [Patescibacteria group bacterium]|nr:rod shape-determining protein RodA [Patescibacteria group bacterium]